MKSVVVLCLAVTFLACRTSSRPGLFTKQTPHELYGSKISNAGLQTTILGRSWFNAAASAVAQPITINKPYKERGSFSAELPSATGLRFVGVRGEKLLIKISRNPTNGFRLYLDLWQQDTTGNSQPRLIASSDTTGLVIQHEVEKSGYFILRIQPELLQNCEYTVEISATAALAFPIKQSRKNQIQSYWGADRDAGARRHEGVDIFAPRRTPVLASANGKVTRVNENNLGGKVVWLRPDKKDYTLYYAHLDSQVVVDGQSVVVGDTLGLLGNTGNARTTAPHLHFGIYTFGGAINPLPFINPDYPTVPGIRTDVSATGKNLRTAGKQNKIYHMPDANSEVTMELPRATLLEVEAATGDFYRVRIPDGRRGYIRGSATQSLSPIRSISISSTLPLLFEPETLSPSKLLLKSGDLVKVLAEFKSFSYVVTKDSLTGWTRDN